MSKDLGKNVQIIIPAPPEAPHDQQSNDAAQSEAMALASGDLKNIAEKNLHERKEKFKDHFAIALIFIFWLMIVVGISASLIWTWHLLLPDYYHFLSDGQIRKIETLIFGGVLSTFLRRAGKEYG